MPIYKVFYQKSAPKAGEVTVSAWCWEEAKRIFKKEFKKCKVISIRKLKATGKDVA